MRDYNMISAQTLEAIKSHAFSQPKRECCGLVIVRKGREVYVPCRNKASRNAEFVIDEQDWARAEDEGEIITVVHSHIGLPPIPSQADLVGIEQTQLPWLIINVPTGNYTITEPSGYVAPLVGRVFSHGVLDCYSLIRDYYQRELGITLKDYAREDEWWRKGQNLYREFFEDAGFKEVPDLQEHDVILMRLASEVDNHGAIYLGNNTIIHHPMIRLSSRDVYGGYWRHITSGYLRHEAFR